MIDMPSQLKDYAEVKGDKDAHHIYEVWRDYWISCVSREASILARREVLTGKAKFGIVGDGKEVPQVALARSFRKGDFKCGYYRDQTFMMALDLLSVEQYFSQLYADQERDPFSAGRQMNSHYSSPLVDQEGDWLDQTTQYNISSDVSCTASQMARALGHALATKLFKVNPSLSSMSDFNDHGNGITVVTIGDASTSEGVFWETMNAAAVMQVPLATCVWDDGYGISVPVELQTVKGSISKALEGFYIDQGTNGIRIYVAKAWDYPTLVECFEVGLEKMRKSHTPALFHIQEVTQPQGHSTSGSHERYKSKERLQWENDFDCIRMMGTWMIESGIASEEQLEELRKESRQYVRACKQRAWQAFQRPNIAFKAELQEILQKVEWPEEIQDYINHEFHKMQDPVAAELVKIASQVRIMTYGTYADVNALLATYINKLTRIYGDSYHTNLYNETKHSFQLIKGEQPTYSNQEKVNGFQVLNAYFDQLFESRPDVIAFGEDVGKIGDVNQGFAHLQEKYGEDRIFDTGIREWTIIGQAMGLAMRGFRPIAEIQYLDYILYAMSPLSDELSTLHYRTNGIQSAPVIVRTRGHRLEGIWHAGSPMGVLVNGLRGMHLCVPRDMTRAVGFYNTLLDGMDPALVIECLNGYRLKEDLPTNLDTFKIPLGISEVLHTGTDITLVTYGTCVRIAEEAIQLLKSTGISVELIDVQTLLPFDLHQTILTSLIKTNKVIFLDEDIPGGATAYMMQQVLEKQGGYKYLDFEPVCITAEAHRTPFGSDGDYFTKPQPETVASKIIEIISNYEPIL